MDLALWAPSSLPAFFVNSALVKRLPFTERVATRSPEMRCYVRSLGRRNIREKFIRYEQRPLDFFFHILDNHRLSYEATYSPRVRQNVFWSHDYVQILTEKHVPLCYDWRVIAQMTLRDDQIWACGPGACCQWQWNGRCRCDHHVVPLHPQVLALITLLSALSIVQVRALKSCEVKPPALF